MRNHEAKAKAEAYAKHCRKAVDPGGDDILLHVRLSDDGTLRIGRFECLIEEYPR